MILNFGEAWQQGSNYGTLLFDNLQFQSTDQITAAVEQFLRGYYACSPSNAFMILGLGLNNQGPNTSNAHGYKWAQMVYQISQWILTPPSYGTKESVRGGMDIEASWNQVIVPATATRPWVDGFASYSPQQYYYNFGDCEGCPWTGAPNVNPTWAKDDIWYVSWGATPALPFPEIYDTGGVLASQWQFMSLYAFTIHGSRMGIQGALTQAQACIDRPAGCSGLDQAPGAGWLQLYAALNSDSRTAQSLPGISDITWIN